LFDAALRDLLGDFASEVRIIDRFVRRCSEVVKLDPEVRQHRLQPLFLSIAGVIAGESNSHRGFNLLAGV
jgi:cytochrome c-type biogenesis protein CcmH/NrfF